MLYLKTHEAGQSAGRTTRNDGRARANQWRAVVPGGGRCGLAGTRRRCCWRPQITEGGGGKRSSSQKKKKKTTKTRSEEKTTKRKEETAAKEEQIREVS